ncbi:MAG: amino acid ABC transporter permease [Sporomusa sp.]
MVDQSFQLSDMLYIAKGLGITLLLCAIAMVCGVVIGLIVGIMRASKVKVLSGISWIYIYIIRGTPLLMQLFLIYYGLPLLIGYSIPSFTVAAGGLSLYAGAYLAEIVRSGIQAVDKGQGEAAKALGLNFVQEYRYVVLPQALRVIVPPGFGFFIALIKDSSLVSAIGFIELARAGKLIVARTFQPFTVYLIIALIYFIICFSLSKVSQKLERTVQG